MSTSTSSSGTSTTSAASALSLISVPVKSAATQANSVPIKSVNTSTTTTSTASSSSGGSGSSSSSSSSSSNSSGVTAVATTTTTSTTTQPVKASGTTSSSSGTSSVTTAATTTTPATTTKPDGDGNKSKKAKRDNKKDRKDRSGKGKKDELDEKHDVPITRRAGGRAQKPRTKAIPFTSTASTDDKGTSDGKRDAPPMSTPPDPTASAPIKESASYGISSRDAVVTSGTGFNFTVPVMNTNAPSDKGVELTAKQVPSLSAVLTAIAGPNIDEVVSRLAKLGIVKPNILSNRAFVDHVLSDAIAQKLQTSKTKFDVPFEPRQHVPYVADVILQIDVLVVRDFWAAYDVQTLPLAPSAMFTMYDVLDDMYMPSGRFASHSAYAWKRVVNLFNYFRANPEALTHTDPLQTYSARPLAVSSGTAFDFDRFRAIVDSRVDGIDFLLQRMSSGDSGYAALLATARAYGNT